MEASSSLHSEKTTTGATLIVRDTVVDYAAPSLNGVFVTHDFPSVEQASTSGADPALAVAMQRGGVASELRIEIFERV